MRLRCLGKRLVIFASLLHHVMAPFSLRAQGPITQQAYLKADTVSAGGGFGSSVAVSGDTAVVASGHDSAYVFVLQANTWSLQARLTGPFFGSLAISGDTIVAGARDQNAAYVFVRQGNAWSQQAVLKASNPGNDYFGYWVAISGDTVVVGAEQEDSNARGVDGDQSNNLAPDSGAAYVFVRQGTVWSQQAYLKASDTERGKRFGEGVAISGDTIVVGPGSVYVFVREGTTWTQQAKLTASNAEEGDGLGSYYMLAISGDTIAAGALFEDSNARGVDGNQSNNDATTSGAAYIFTRTGSTWTQEAYLKASNTGIEDRFARVAISGDLVVVGANGEDSNAVGIDGNQLNNSAPESGAAYVFGRTGTNWRQRAYLKASNTGSQDFFGLPVAVSDGTILVGAPYEDSNATGVNGPQTNNNAPDSGAVYVFTIPETPPPLSVALNVGGVRVSWPSSATDWRLEQSETMGNASWTLIPAPYSSNAEGIHYDVISPAGPGFFRLRKP